MKNLRSRIERLRKTSKENEMLVLFPNEDGTYSSADGRQWTDKDLDKWVEKHPRGSSNRPQILIWDAPRPKSNGVIDNNEVT